MIIMVSEKGKFLAEKFGYLPETIERFLQLFGLEETKDILQAYERKPKTAIRINELKINPPELIERMEKRVLFYHKVIGTKMDFSLKKHLFH